MLAHPEDAASEANKEQHKGCSDRKDHLRRAIQNLSFPCHILQPLAAAQFSTPRSIAGTGQCKQKFLLLLGQMCRIGLMKQNDCIAYIYAIYALYKRQHGTLSRPWSGPQSLGRSHRPHQPGALSASPQHPKPAAGHCSRQTPAAHAPSFSGLCRMGVREACSAHAIVYTAVQVELGKHER